MRLHSWVTLVRARPSRARSTHTHKGDNTRLCVTLVANNAHPAPAKRSLPAERVPLFVSVLRSIARADVLPKKGERGHERSVTVGHDGRRGRSRALGRRPDPGREEGLKAGGRRRCCSSVPSGPLLGHLPVLFSRTVSDDQVQLAVPEGRARRVGALVACGLVGPDPVAGALSPLELLPSR